MGSEAPPLPAVAGDAPPSPTSKALPLDGSVVKMKGLPFKASVDDVSKFYSGFGVTAANVFMKRHPDGRLNGEAFVCFDSPDDARRACAKDRETFGDKWGERYVRVYPTLESDVPDMQQAVAQQNMPVQPGGHAHHMDSVVKVKSLPFDACQLDVILFFEGFRLKPNGVQLIVRADNKPTGEAFVDFETPEEAGRALRERDHKVFGDKFGDRYVRLIQVSRKEMLSTLSLRFGGEGIIKVKGIPFKASPGDVRKFFAGHKVRPDGVSFIMHQDGRPTGMAFIEFESPAEALRAMDKDRAKFGPEYGDRFCMLQLVGRHEMDKVPLQREGGDAAKMMPGMGVNPAAMMQMLQALLSNPAAIGMMMGQAPWMGGPMLGAMPPPPPGGANGHHHGGANGHHHGGANGHGNGHHHGGPHGGGHHGSSQHNGHALPGGGGGSGSSSGSGGSGGVDPSALAAAAQFGQQLAVGNIAGALNGLGLGSLPHQGGHGGGHMQQHGAGPDVGGAGAGAASWMAGGSPDNMVFYQGTTAGGGGGGMDRTWGDHR